MASEPRIRLLPSESNPTQVEWNGLSVHSRNPIMEAQRQAARLLSSGPEIIFCFGPGLAYVVEELLRLTTKPIVWIEESLAMRAAALCRLEPIFRAQTLAETTDTGSAEIRQWRSGHALRLVLFTRTPTVHQLRGLFGESLHSHSVNTTRATIQPAYLNLIAELERLSFRETVNRNTLHRFDRIWVKNAYYNFRHSERFLPVDDLTARFSGIPAVIASAGPSLDQVLPILRARRDRFILLAVDTALAPLAHAGVDPDFALSVDAQPANFLHARAYRGKAHWILDPTVSYLLLRQMSSNVTVFENRLPLVAGLFTRLGMGSPGALLSGGSVSTNAYDLALKMGCDPIYLCGLDLSFPGFRIHARGSALEEAIHAQSSRLNTIEAHNYRQLTAIDRRYLPAAEGAHVQTNDKLQIFFEWYTRKFRELPDTGRIRNVYGGGAWFDGIPSLTPAALVEELSSLRPIHGAIHAALSLLNQRRSTPVAPDIRWLADLRIELRGIQTDLEKIIEMLYSADHPALLNDQPLQSLEQRLAKQSDLVRMLSNGMQKSLSDYMGQPDEDPALHMNFYRDLRQACLLHLRMIEE